MFDLERIIPAHFSDWVRLAVIAEYGGFWLDASIIVTNSLDELSRLVSVKKSEGLLYSVNSTITERFPLVDNWFISSVPHGVLVTAWLFEYTLAMRIQSSYLSELRQLYGLEEYGNLVRHIHNGWNDTSANYFKANICLQKIIQINRIPLSLVLQADSESGPMSIYHQMDWNGYKYAKALLDKWDEHTVVPLMFKLTHHSRNYILDLVNEHYPVHPDSIYSKYLN